MITMQPNHRKNLLPYYVKGLANGKFTLTQASESTGYTNRYLWELKRKYLTQGMAIFETPQRKSPPNKIPEWIRQRIVKIYLKDYQDVNFKYFSECLKEYEDIDISYHTVRLIMNDYGIKSPDAHHIKKKKTVHRQRFCRQNEGDLIQIDGTPFAWFSKFGDNKRYALHGSIDDATGKITALYMTENECLYGYLEILRQTIQNHGIPREIYSDRAAIFCVTPKNKKNLTVWEELAGIHDKRTQWQRILSELSINQILAWSPQAKGKVERMWQTLQGQLPQYFYLNGVNSVEKANKILHNYIEYFNSKYQKQPVKQDVFYRDYDIGIPLDDLLCARIPRKTDHSGVFSFHGYKWQIMDYNRVACRNFELCISEKGLYANLDNNYYPVHLLDDILDSIDETMPQVLQNIVYRYMYAFAKEISI